MRILQVINRMMRGGGAEKIVCDLSLALNKIEGVEVDVLSIAPPLNDDMVTILQENGVDHFVLSNSLYSGRNVGRLRSFVAIGAYDVVHVHLFPALYYAGAAKLTGKFLPTLAYTEHSTSNRRRNKLLFRKTDKIIYRQYNKIIAISPQVKRNLEAHLGWEGVRVVHNGIDTTAIYETPPSALRAELQIPEDSTVVTMVSRVTPGKDFSTLILAIEQLPEFFHILFVGDGPLMTELKNRKEKSSASTRIHILGLRKDVIEIEKGSDIIVLSTQHEGFSIAMLEAMACHKPFVASAVEGIKDLVSDVAVLFEYKDATALAEILMKLYNDKSYRNDVADRCLNFASRYDINLIAQQYIEQYSL